MKLYLASASPRRRELLKLLPYEFEVHIPDFDERAYEEQLKKRYLAECSQYVQSGCNPDFDSRQSASDPTAEEVFHPDSLRLTREQPSPEALTLEIARGKALCAYRELKAIHPEGDFIVLSADTIVLLEGEVLGKGENREKSLAMLKKLNGKTHEVITAVWVIGTRKDAAGLCVCGNPLHSSVQCSSSAQCSSSVEHSHFIEKYLLEKSTVTFGENDEEWLERYVDSERPFDKAGAYGIQDGGALFVEKIEGSYHNVMGLPVRKVFLSLDKVLHQTEGKMQPHRLE